MNIHSVNIFLANLMNETIYIQEIGVDVEPQRFILSGYKVTPGHIVLEEYVGGNYNFTNVHDVYVSDEVITIYMNSGKVFEVRGELHLFNNIPLKVMSVIVNAMDSAYAEGGISYHQLQEFKSWFVTLDSELQEQILRLGGQSFGYIMTKID